MPLVTSEAYDEAALAALIAAATVLGSDLKAGLYTNNPTPSKVLAIADMTEPTYTGYARQLVVMGPAIRDPINGIASLAASLAWEMSNSATPTIVNGMFFTFGAGPAFMGIFKFDTPIPLNDQFDSFTTVLEYIQSNQFAGTITIIR